MITLENLCVKLNNEEIEILVKEINTNPNLVKELEKYNKAKKDFENGTIEELMFFLFEVKQNEEKKYCENYNLRKLKEKLIDKSDDINLYLTNLNAHNEFKNLKKREEFKSKIFSNINYLFNEEELLQIFKKIDCINFNDENNFVYFISTTEILRESKNYIFPFESKEKLVNNYINLRKGGLLPEVNMSNLTHIGLKISETNEENKFNENYLNAFFYLLISKYENKDFGKNKDITGNFDEEKNKFFYTGASKEVFHKLTDQLFLIVRLK